MHRQNIATRLDAAADDEADKERDQPGCCTDWEDLDERFDSPGAFPGWIAHGAGGGQGASRLVSGRGQFEI